MEETCALKGRGRYRRVVSWGLRELGETVATIRRTMQNIRTEAQKHRSTEAPHQISASRVLQGARAGIQRHIRERWTDLGLLEGWNVLTHSYIGHGGNAVAQNCRGGKGTRAEPRERGIRMPASGIE